MKQPGNFGVYCALRSRPAGARGLKQAKRDTGFRGILVAPRRGAWIETGGCQGEHGRRGGRAPQGRVD